jgi:subtilisin family serine protease
MKFGIFILVLSSFYTAIAGMTVSSSVHRPKVTQYKVCKGKPTVIAVIDSGFGAGFENETVRLCKFGHRDFSQYGVSDSRFGTTDPVPTDNHGHGTNVAGVIDKYASRSNVNYCIVIIKYFDPFRFSVDQNEHEKATIKAIMYATDIHADYINYSSGGAETNGFEINAVKRFIDQGGKFIAAAGNEHSDLAKNPYYPAMDDDRVIVVGNKYKNGKVAQSSNYGDRVDRWEVGDETVFGREMMGTSQAAAVATGKLVSESKNICK